MPSWRAPLDLRIQSGNVLVDFSDLKKRRVFCQAIYYVRSTKGFLVTFAYFDRLLYKLEYRENDRSVTLVCDLDVFAKSGCQFGEWYGASWNCDDGERPLLTPEERTRVKAEIRRVLEFLNVRDVVVTLHSSSDLTQRHLWRA